MPENHHQECKNRVACVVGHHTNLMVLHELGWDPKVLFCRVDRGFVLLVGKECMVTCAMSTDQFRLRRLVSL